MRTPGNVRIGCTTMTIEQWLGAEGAAAARPEGCSSGLEHATLTHWLHMLAVADPARLGWIPDVC
jgi:hypothetical protein